MKSRITIQTDSYKSGQAPTYKSGTQVIYSYLESRGGRFSATVMFGVQYYLKEYLSRVVTKEDVDVAEKFWNAHMGRTDYFNRARWDYIVDKLGGKLPIKIKAAPEGTVVPVKNVLMTIENTDENCFWLTNWIETLILKIWYPITVCSQSKGIYDNIKSHLEKSGTPEAISFKAHDFGYRGCPSEESSALGAAAHLAAGFMGTDTVSGIQLLQEYYGAGMCGFSIPATEHSNVCSYGLDGEEAFCENFLDLFPEGPIACVSDTRNIYNSVSNIWGGKLRDKVLARNGVLVIRPDSGDFMEIIPWILQECFEKFGGYTNSKGYKVINDKVRVIQGDGMNPDTIDQLYSKIEELGWSADNLTVGSGGGLLVTGIDRDTCKFAVKASAAKINGEWIDIYKSPITDKGKVSKKGRLKLVKENGSYVTVAESDPRPDEMQVVFLNGEVVNPITFEQIRKNAQETQPK